jgi:hypothetical protein
MPPKKQSLRKQVVSFIVSAIYFLYWSYSFSLGAVFGILVAAFAPLAVELFGGVYHAGEVPLPGSHWARWLLVAGYWMLLLAFALRHLREAQAHQREKYALAFRLGRLYELERIMAAQGKTADLIEALKQVHAMFEPLKVAHVALHRKRDGKISIAHNEVFPPPSDPNTLPIFDEGQGIAGRVFTDLVTRYVPRIYLPVKRWERAPAMLLPHALTLAFESVNETKNEPALQNVAIDLNVLESPPNGKFMFNSFLSLPVKSASNGQCMAVLSLDFGVCNSLKKADIALAYDVANAIGRFIGEAKSETKA